MLYPYINHRILQHSAPHANAIVLDRTLTRSSIVVFQKPTRPLLVVGEFGRVVALVEVLKHSGEDFGLLLRQVDAFARGFEELCPTVLGEGRGFAEDILVGGEEALGGSDADGDDGGVEVAAR